MACNYTRFAELGRKVVAVGRNYKEHAAELGNAVPDKPLLFMKPATAYITEGKAIKIPKGCQNLHHEVELGVVIGKTAKDVTEESAMSFVAGYCLALDMTARDFQNAAKEKGAPWEVSKGFDTSCPVSGFIPKSAIPDPHNANLWCNVNGVVRQKGNTKDMIFNIPHLISFISQYFTLEPNDVILTGTPAGVGPVKDGDLIEAGLDSVVKMSFKVEN